MSARAEDAARALSREQPTTADAAVPTPANNGSADAEGVEIPAPEPSGNKNLLGVVAVAGGMLAAGGMVGAAALPDGLYDEASGRWFALPHPMAQPRARCDLVSLPAAALLAPAPAGAAAAAP